MQEVYEFLKKCVTYYLATVDGDQARVRPFGTIDLFDGRLTIQTGKVKDVSGQNSARLTASAGCASQPARWRTRASKRRSICSRHTPRCRACTKPGTAIRRLLRLST